MALNRSLIGKTYPHSTSVVTLEALQRYARAYNDDNPAYFGSSAAGGIVAPPMFNVVVTWLALITVISDPELCVDLMRLLHQRQDMQFFAPIRCNDQISATATIISIENSRAGEFITIGLEASNQHQMVSLTHFTALIRGRRGGDRAAGTCSAAAALRHELVLSVSQSIDHDQTVRYAEASGDRNPIHLDSNVARMAGLPGIIVQGLCTMAFTSKVIVDHLCGGNPLCLKRLAVSFSRPVFPGDLITTSVWRDNTCDELMCFSFETVNQAGAAIIRHAIAEVDRGEGNMG